VQKYTVKNTKETHNL